MTPPAALGAVRRDFLRHRRRVLGAAGVTVGALAGLGALLLAPDRLASIRVGGVALAWWVAAGVVGTALVTLGRGFRTGRPGPVAGDATARLAPLALAAIWGSPALWLGLPPLLLGDGVRGLWPATALIGGALVAMLVLAPPWRRAEGGVARPSAIARHRWPEARGCRGLLEAIEALVAVLFVWAQLAVARELGAQVGWPWIAPLGIMAAVLAAGLLREPFRLRLAGVGGGLAVLGLAAPLVLVAVGTTTSWPGVWSAVASRPRVAFLEDTPWTRGGVVVHGPGAPATLRFADEQRVVFVGRGTVRVEPPGAHPVVREVEAGDDLLLHPGDRLIVPRTLRLRFEPGRRVPDAPDSGPEWVDPPARSAGWLGLLALGLTGFLGALGLPVAAVPGPGGGLPPRRGAQLTAGLVIAGTALVVGWSLYAAWLTPEVYAGGVTGAEVFALADGASRLGGWGPLLTGVALGALGLGAAASTLAGMRALPGGGGPAGADRARSLSLLPVAGAGLLACLVPTSAWGVLVLALGLAASTLAPAAVLACWSERATPLSVAAGATVGLLGFLGLLVTGVGSPTGAPDVWTGVIAAAPATIAVPAHLVVGGLLRSARPARLSPGLLARTE